MNRVQDTGHIVGLAGLYTADGVGELNPLQSIDGNKYRHIHKKREYDTQLHDL